MRLSEISNIKNLRKKYGINQKELALRSGVSQSLIAKIESGLVDPTYSKAQNIFEALEALSKKYELCAKDVMTKNIFSCGSAEKMKKIIGIMKNQNISQLPVIDGDNVIGIVTETSIVSYLSEYEGNVGELIASDFMNSDVFLISENTSLHLMLGMMKETFMLIIAKKGKVLGIVTRSDLLKGII